MNKAILSNANFYRSSGFYIAASAFASILNYLLYPLLAKVLSPAELGDVGVIATIIIQLSSILLAFNVVSIYLVAREKDTAVAKLESIQRVLVRLSAAVAIGIVVLLPFLRNLLQIEGYLPLLGLSLLLITVIPTIIWTGYLLGHKELPLIGIYNIVNALAKVVGAVTLAKLGLGAGGAVFGLLIGYVVSLVLLKKLSKHRLPFPAQWDPKLGIHVT